VRVDLHDVSLGLTPTDAERERGWPVDVKVWRDAERNCLATRKVDELGGDSDGWRAETYTTTIMVHLRYCIPARREGGVFTMSGLQGDEIITFPLFREG